MGLTDYTEVFGQAVTYEYTPTVDKHAKLLVDYLKWRQRMPRQMWV